jgi:predicted ATPase/DNA-binding SARP family transcriptional activator
MSDHCSAPLTVRCFGPFRVWVRGEPLPRLRSRKGSWLLALLALHADRDMDRDWLAATLWPGSAPASALYSLRMSLKDLRGALGPEADRLRSPAARRLRLNLEGTDVDLQAFDVAIARGDTVALQHAVALYSGPLLEGWQEEWAVRERRLREEAFLSVLETLARDSMTRGHPDAATRFLRRAVAVDPARERTQRALMQALASEGQLTAALRVYEEVRALLRRELGAEPDPETQELRDRIALDLSPTPGASWPHRAGVRRRDSLPAPPTPLVGRADLVAAVSGTLSGHEVRLITLTGPGGVGKTRVAIQVAMELREQFPDGAFFVALASVTSEDEILDAIARVLGIRESADRSQREALRDGLDDQALLLVLDNFEHLSDLAPLVAEILACAPRLKLLVTSRSRLHLRGEHEVLVPPLPLPEPRGRLRATEIEPWPSVALFLQCARAIRPAFALTAANAPIVARICCRLDGVPLAIELAAAQLWRLSPDELLAQLGGSQEAPAPGSALPLLVDGPRDLPPRQRTLRDTIEWSYRLLTDDEQRLFRRLSVFAGGFTGDAAIAVGADEALGAPAVSAALQALLEQHLVQREHSPTEEIGAERAPRYVMLETIWEFAWRSLYESGEADRTSQRHAEHFCGLVEGQIEGSDSLSERQWLSQLDQEFPNLRAAIAGCIERGEAETGMRLARIMIGYLPKRGAITEGRLLLAQLLRLSKEAPPTPARGAALIAAFVLAWIQGEFGTALQLLDESEATWEALGDRFRTAYILICRTMTFQSMGRLQEALQTGRQSVAAARALGEPWLTCWALVWLAPVTHQAGDERSARADGEECLAHFRGSEDPHCTAIALNVLADIDRYHGEYASARARLHECLALVQALTDKICTARALASLGALAHADALRQAIGARMLPLDLPAHQHALQHLRTVLGEARFAAAWAEGRAASPEQEIARRLDAIEPT